jgi:outer membrane protein OmpA-like peptidoglycan-associated protein
MRSSHFLLALLLVALSSHAAWAVPMDDPNGTPEPIATWGATTPNTVLHWTFATSPSPAIQGTPDHLVKEFGFSKESTGLNREAMGAMHRMIADLRRDGRDLKTVRLAVVGFADNVTEASNARQIGLRRAEAARNFLENFGISKDHIQVASFGSAYSFAKSFEYVRQRFDRRASIWIVE